MAEDPSDIRIVYIGNELEARGGSPTSIDLLAPLLREEGYTVDTASSKRNRLLRLFEMLSLVWKRSDEADLVLIDTYSTTNFWYAYLVARLSHHLQLKYVPILHGGDLPNRIENTSRSTDFLFRKAFVNVSPSLYLKGIIEKRGITEVQYVPNSIELEAYPFVKRVSLRPRLLWVRAFAEVYNPMLAVEVLEELQKEFPEAELCMVGPEKDQSFQECQEYVNAHKLPVRFCGRLSKTEWHSLSRQYDIFLNTSQVDNTPVSVIEAMALGLPVISTEVGGMPYLIDQEKNGLLIPAGSVSGMAGAVKHLISDPNLAGEISENARKKVEAFDWKEVKKNWNELLTGSKKLTAAPF